MNETHKCRDCDRQIPAHIPVCIYCKPKYRERNLCWWCGERPRKERQKGKPQSQYCNECQMKTKGYGLLPAYDERTISSKSAESYGRKQINPQQSAHLNDTE